MRGVQSKVLHKEVIDNFRLKKHQEQQKAFQQETQPEIPCAVTDEDMPVPGLENPYAKPAPKCILCDHNIELDYKNSRLLSQFVSPHTGRIYGRQITGLCIFMQRHVAKLIKRSRYFGFMPYVHKDPRYLRDPKLFDPFRRK
jgi:small subunit ribosomal protein S18